MKRKIKNVFDIRILQHLVHFETIRIDLSVGFMIDFTANGENAAELKRILRLLLYVSKVA